jgi:hypothetical protein
LDES